jgi:hypothetical protein
MAKARITTRKPPRITKAILDHLNKVVMPEFRESILIGNDFITSCDYTHGIYLDGKVYDINLYNEETTHWVGNVKGTKPEYPMPQGRLYNVYSYEEEVEEGVEYDLDDYLETDWQNMSRPILIRPIGLKNIKKWKFI